MKKRILLIEPPFFRLFKDTYSLSRFPLSLAYLSGTIQEKTDWEVKVLNADFIPNSEPVKIAYFAGAGFNNYINNLKNPDSQIWKKIQSDIREFDPSVVGITTKTQNFASAQVVAKVVKEINKNIIVIVGGPHPSMVNGQVLECPDIDISVKGEGEETIIDLLEAFSKNEKNIFKNIKGIIYRGNGKIIENPFRGFIQDLDSLCYPHEASQEVLIDYEKYHKNAFRSIFATRGCPYNCLFCGSRHIWSRKVRFRSVQNVITEIQGLQKKEINDIHFDDDTFGIKKNYIHDLCNSIIDQCPGLKWSCEINVKLVNDDIIRIMKKSGCYKIEIGVESGNNDILKQIRKNITIEEAYEASRLIRKYGIELQTFFIIGFPQDTEKTINDTIKAIKKIQSDIIVCSIFTPYPGTEAFNICKEHGLVDDSYDVSLYNHQSMKACFCLTIPPDKFQSLASQVFKLVDRKNWINRIKRSISIKNIKKIRREGIIKIIQKSIRIVINK